jgi:hypothetical protein
MNRELLNPRRVAALHSRVREPVGHPGIGHKGKMPLLPTPDIAAWAGCSGCQCSQTILVWQPRAEGPGPGWVCGPDIAVCTVAQNLGDSLKSCYKGSRWHGCRNHA